MKWIAPFTWAERYKAKQEIAHYMSHLTTQVFALSAWEREWLKGAIRHALANDVLLPDARSFVLLEAFLAKLETVADRHTMTHRAGPAEAPAVLKGPADDTGQSRIDVAIPEDREY